jgi:hypothetical protein
MISASWMILALAVLVGAVVFLDIHEHRSQQEP